MRKEMNKENKKAVLKNCLEFFSVWFSLRTKEILKDNIDIEQ